VIEEYKRWLWLKSRYPKEGFTPPDLVDFAWHHHILDTKAYAHDCEQLFGRFLHHNPLFDRESYITLRKDFTVIFHGMMHKYKRSLFLYEHEFGAGSLPTDIWKTPWKDTDIPDFDTINYTLSKPDKERPLYHIGVSPISGEGLFASQFLSKGTILGQAWSRPIHYVSQFASKINHCQKKT